MKLKRIINPLSWRIYFIISMFCLCFFLLIGRAYYLHIIPSAEKTLDNIASNQYFQSQPLAPYRGAIFDHNGEALALSAKKATLFVNPKVFNPTTQQLQKLGRITGQSVERILALKRRSGYFAYLVRMAAPEVGEAAMNLGISGLYLANEPARTYPGGSLAAPLLGFVGIDNQGLAGLELQFDKDLQGDRATITPSKDARGRMLFLNSSDYKPERTGNHIYLTIDRVIQRIAEKALEEGVKNANARSGFVIVADPHTGRLLSVANYPTFSPNQTRSLGSYSENLRNRAFLDVFEPGSVVKPIVVANAVAEKKINFDTMHNCENGKLKIGKHYINDVKPHKNLNTVDVLINSSNVCIYKIAQKLSEEGLYKGLQKFGFGLGRSFYNIPGSQYGRISPWKDWRTIRFANIAFGQGMVATGLEIVSAYSAIANGGRWIEPQIIDKITSSEGVVLRSFRQERVNNIMAQPLAAKMRETLAKVVEHPSLHLARLDGYSAGGKTGTTEKVDAETKAYSKTKRIASFAGFAPANDPYIVVYVYIDEPGKRPYFGSLWAAPVFKQVAQETLQYLGVTPDLPAKNAKISSAITSGKQIIEKEVEQNF